MYLFILLIMAVFFISVISLNWPVKIYHHFRLTKIAEMLGTVAERNSIFANVYSQINMIYQGKPVKIRFLEASIDSLHPHSALEIRVITSLEVVAEIFHSKDHQQARGDFQRFLSGDQQLDQEWLILTTDMDAFESLWRDYPMADLFKEPHIELLLFNHHEVVAQLKHIDSPQKVINMIQRIVQSLPN